MLHSTNTIRCVIEIGPGGKETNKTFFLITDNCNLNLSVGDIKVDTIYIASYKDEQRNRQSKCVKKKKDHLRLL